MTEAKLIAAIAEAIENNSTIEGEEDNSLIFGKVKSISTDRTGLSVKFEDGKKYRISVEESWVSNNELR